jgi:plastocyanin
MAKRTKARPKRGILNNTTLAVGALALLGVVAVAAWYALDGGGSPKRKLVRQTAVVSTEKQVNVDVIDNDFTPRVLTVNKGATVTWRFTGDIPHNVTDDRGAFASESQSSGEYVRTFDTPGIFYYYCTIHHGMLGTLTVKE